MVTDEELGSVEPRKTRTIDIETFVDLADVDPIYFDHPYFLVPAGESEGTLRAYQLLVEAMESEERVALGRFVMRTKEYLVAVRVRDGALALTTMLFHDEVRPTKQVPTGGGKPAKGEVDQAVAIIEALPPSGTPSATPTATGSAWPRSSSASARVRRWRPRAGAAAAEAGARPDGGPPAHPRPGARGGRPPSRAGRGRGDEDLAELSRDELNERARSRKIAGRSKMSKKELVEALSGDSS